MKRIIGAVAAIFAISVTIGYFILDKKELPIYNPHDLNPELVDANLRKKTRGHTVSDFELTNQYGQTITGKNLEGKIYVVDFFFTTCGTICPKMTRQLERVQKRFKDEPSFMIVSHTVTPQNDTPGVLKKYGEKHGALPDKWWFLTGLQDHIFHLARKSYFAVIPGSSGAEEGFVHTENFVLVDKEGRLRGFYNGTRTEEVNQLMDDIKTLIDAYK